MEEPLSASVTAPPRASWPMPCGSSAARPRARSDTLCGAVGTRALRSLRSLSSFAGLLAAAATLLATLSSPSCCIRSSLIRIRFCNSTPLQRVRCRSSLRQHSFTLRACACPKLLRNAQRLPRRELLLCTNSGHANVLTPYRSRTSRSCSYALGCATPSALSAATRLLDFAGMTGAAVLVAYVAPGACSCRCRCCQLPGRKQPAKLACLRRINLAALRTRQVAAQMKQLLLLPPPLPW